MAGCGTRGFSACVMTSGHQRWCGRFDVSASEYRLRVDGHDVAIANPDKLLFPEDHISKRELVDYYQRVAPRMLSVSP